jgi:hypothetical protein
MEALTVLKGLLAGGITMGVAAVFPEELSLAFFTVVLGLAAGVYPGFAMANPESGRPLIQWVAAVVFVSLGMVGLWISPLILAAAWVLHAFWDFLHHITALGDGVPEGYPAFCISYDLLLAGFVAYMWAAGA